MNFLEVRPGLNVSKHKIISVESVDEMTCKIGTAIGTYDCIYPSWRVLMLLEQPDIEEQLAQPQTPVDRVNLFGAQHWAG